MFGHDLYLMLRCCRKIKPKSPENGRRSGVCETGIQPFPEPGRARVLQIVCKPGDSGHHP